ncbi:hypothetical protein X559_3012 [Paenilisteria newyorkensis]|nr:hypothetical protein X559_3012 [Listeria newyorkensis]
MEFSNIYRFVYFAVFLFLFLITVVLYFAMKAYGHTKWLTLSSICVFLLIVGVYAKYVVDTFIYYE